MAIWGGVRPPIARDFLKAAEKARPLGARTGQAKTCSPRLVSMVRERARPGARCLGPEPLGEAARARLRSGVYVLD